MYARGNFGQDDFGNEGQVEFARPRKRHPLQVRKLFAGGGKVIEIALDRSGIHQEETGIEIGAGGPAG